VLVFFEVLADWPGSGEQAQMNINVKDQSPAAKKASVFCIKLMPGQYLLATSNVL
jgi:hypothetical protein